MSDSPTGGARGPGRLLDRLASVQAASGRALRAHWIPLATAVALAAFGVWLDRLLRTEDDFRIRGTVEAEAGRLRSEIAEMIDARLQSLAQSAARWQYRLDGPQPAWQADLTGLVRDDLQYGAVAWLEPSLELRWVEPPTARLPRFPLDPQDDEVRGAALDLLRARGEPSISWTVPLASGHRQIVALAPMFAGERPAGYLMGVMRARDLLDVALHQAIVSGYSVTVYEGPYLLYGPTWEQSGPEGQWSRDAELHVGSLGWRIKVWPSAELAARLEGHGASAAVALVALLAIAVPIGIHLAQKAARRRVVPGGTGGAEYCNRQESEPGEADLARRVHRLHSQEQHDDEDEQADQRAVE